MSELASGFESGTAPERANELACVMLAAGGSRRFGDCKLAQPLQPGCSVLQTSLLELVCFSSNNGLNAPKVVLGAYQAKLADLLLSFEPKVKMVCNPDWQQGISTSIIAGLQAAVYQGNSIDHQGYDSDDSKPCEHKQAQQLPSQQSKQQAKQQAKQLSANQIKAVLITLGDQVAIRSDDYQRLFDAYKQSGQICASRYRDQLGVPAIFPYSAFSKLMQLEGDKGAKAIIKQAQLHGKVTEVPIANAQFDIDTPTDLQLWLASKER
ncbi:nucleotidyltransferase family protein [Shewanella maritima]|uniref:Nucleotidyltransferase family protein n=1 Tax=Shewanella maritima TaxID=2520507 RepID=A0A411PDT6_9GAMM|nr:nucleotidyltransferase family protein [Shewanella maritima]QBF81691.1 nucleotidyltransferase family protein [Shewanella maritima]